MTRARLRLETLREGARESLPWRKLRAASQACLTPKRIVWAKRLHKGGFEGSAPFTGSSQLLLLGKNHKGLVVNLCMSTMEGEPYVFESRGPIMASNWAV